MWGETYLTHTGGPRSFGGHRRRRPKVSATTQLAKSSGVNFTRCAVSPGRAVAAKAVGRAT